MTDENGAYRALRNSTQTAPGAPAWNFDLAADLRFCCTERDQYGECGHVQAPTDSGTEGVK